jgi:hypothetical protein
MPKTNAVLRTRSVRSQISYLNINNNANFILLGISRNTNFLKKKKKKIALLHRSISQTLPANNDGCQSHEHAIDDSVADVELRISNDNTALQDPGRLSFRPLAVDMIAESFLLSANHLAQLSLQNE